jgi:hypothetical protein
MKVKEICSDLPASSFAETDFSGKYLILFKHGIFRMHLNVLENRCLSDCLITLYRLLPLYFLSSERCGVIAINLQEGLEEASVTILKHFCSISLERIL